MTRQLLLVAIVGLLSPRLAAEEQLIRFADQEDSAPASTLLPDIQMRIGVAERADELGTMAEPSAYDSYDVAMTLGDTLCADGHERGFRPACGCCCDIPCQDNWCACDSSCCNTSCWVEHPCQCSDGNCYLDEGNQWVCNDARCDVRGTDACPSNAAVRFGWWAVDADGSPTKVGEYQDLDSSPFWDVDMISSDGVRTWDMVLSGLDEEASDARVRFYRPGFSANVEYQRYFRSLDHDLLTGFDLNGPVAPGPDDNVVSEDLNVGEDYAIRVQEVDAKFKGVLTENLKWRLNVWTQRKFGERQVNATAHCFDIDPAPGNQNRTCHVLSQRQTIDWRTFEIQPALEAEFDNVTVEYSRTMRTFGQEDGVSARQYSRTPFAAINDEWGPDYYNYASVPENVTQIDRLKVDARLNECNQFYANLFVGETENNFRETHRDFYGFDLRLMNSTFDRMHLTGYASVYDESNELPPFFLDTPPWSPAPVPPAISYDETSVRHPVDYTRTRVGLKGDWRFADRSSCRYGLWNGASLAWGYEYYQLERNYAVYQTAAAFFTQPDTVVHEIEFGPSTRWSRTFDTYLRYKVRFVDVPLIGVSEYSEDDPDVLAAFNSNQPEQEHEVVIGGSWRPTTNFMTTAQFSLINSWHDSEYANFSEDNYPFYCTVWYAPTNRLSLTGAYAYYSNWIDQDITLGANRLDLTETERTRWSYAGENHLVSINANYAWNRCLQLVGGYEFNRGRNVFAVPVSPHAADGVDWSLLPYLSDVVVDTHRVTAGVDWQPWRHAGTYFRYIYFDYDDESAGYDSGTANMFLAGVMLTQ